jgi:diadenosine tetraphosphatase ApaH/serine/threonine PP2A family protein phosphatase
VAAANLDAFDTRWCLFGHTHYPVVYLASDRGVEAIIGIDGDEVALEGRALINPGSVGQPRDGNPAASYLVLDTDAGRAAYRRVTYDIAATQRQMLELGLPPRLAERLSYGR